MTLTPHEGSELALTPDQRSFNEAQRAALVHMGVEGASEGDLQVFHHVVQRTGLDPFAKQIYMIGRQVSVPPSRENDQWTKVTKWTIQTGIDGFRLIGRRAANKAHHKVSVAAPEWAHRDGTWRPVWDREWGLPLAARVTIHRDGEPFTAVALFDEYKQLKSNGGLTAMWEQRPAGQLAKCAEALAWRMAFPQDLSGIYADEEMEQADNPHVEQLHDQGERITADAIRGQQDRDAEGAPNPQPDPAEPVDAVLAITDTQSREIGELLQYIGITQRKKAVDYLNDCLPEGRTVRARADLTTEEAEGVLLALRDDKAKQDERRTDEVADPATEQPIDPWAGVEVKQPPADTTGADEK